MAQSSTGPSVGRWLVAACSYIHIEVLLTDGRGSALLLSNCSSSGRLFCVEIVDNVSDNVRKR